MKLIWLDKRVHWINSLSRSIKKDDLDKIYILRVFVPETKIGRFSQFLRVFSFAIVTRNLPNQQFPKLEELLSQLSQSYFICRMVDEGKYNQKLRTIPFIHLLM
eukprot:TRINITY_DN21926_c0_g1_i2.p5 TRINITY_DN21926_c0_g1~~TRINITY_DN21926_c0_g1_i2.p5  ORF type:complete len:104 (-),score=0.60 TRINITY_DN21926_c0_g1_i2:267-578(-)